MGESKTDPGHQDNQGDPGEKPGGEVGLAGGVGLLAAPARLRGESGRWGRDDGEWRGDAMDRMTTGRAARHTPISAAGEEIGTTARWCVRLSFYCLSP